MHTIRASRLPGAGLCLVLAGLVLLLTGCNEIESAAVSGYEPSKLEAVSGTEIPLVTFTQEGADRTGLQTAAVTASGGHIVAPYASVIYDPEGGTYVYTVVEPLSFMREEVTVDRVVNNRVLLSDGPAAGTEVVTVGLAEVYGTELEVAGH